ncbi:MAG: NAD-dependent epimerase/dehydratase family protein [Deltaproteobacteria bacterium]|nr:NAD-dependent epimerase/dehydratase family protein [Deltaproteobacteria bacterium]
MRVFVTGAAGFLGRRLLARLARDGHATSALLLPDEPDPGLGDARVIRGDVTEPESLAGLLAGHDAVVHLAALVGYGQRMDECLRVNRDGTRNIAAAALEAGARRFVQLSSVSVYGRAAGIPIDEEAPLQKTGDPYGDTKIDAERILAEHSRRGELDLTMLRPTVITGPGDDKFLGKVAENLRSGRARIIGRGDHAVDALHVDDVVELLARILPDPRTFGRTYNVAQPANPAWNEFLPFFAEALGVPPPRDHLPYHVALALAGLFEAIAWLRGEEPRLTRYSVRVIGRPYNYVTDRAKRELGFEPKRDLRTAVHDWMK